MSALPFNASDSIHILYGIHASISSACLRRRLVGVGLPCYHANGYPPGEMNRYVEQGAMSWTLYDHAHPLSTCFTFQNSARIWEIGGVSTDP